MVFNMDMNLDSGDVGIEDTLYEYFLMNTVI